MTYSKELHDRVRQNLRMFDYPRFDGGDIDDLLDEIDRLTAANKWVSVSEIKKTHSGNRVLIHMANDFVVIATYYKHDGGHFRNDNGSIVAFNDVIEYMNIPLPTPPTGGE